MRASVLFACVLFSVPCFAAKTKTSASIDYNGPLGLTWGQSREDVKAALDGKLTLNKEDDTGIMYSGNFADIATDAIVVIFDESGLVAVAVVLQSTDDRPASQKWTDVVDEMTKKYGKPTSIVPPPGRPSMSTSVNAYPETKNKKKLQELSGAMDALMAGAQGVAQDNQIVSGAWKPNAKWAFKNGANIMVSVRVGQPDEFGSRSLSVAWGFFRKSFEELVRRERETRSDF
jgi:hypothetical protein